MNLSRSLYKMFIIEIALVLWLAKGGKKQEIKTRCTVSSRCTLLRTWLTKDLGESYRKGKWVIMECHAALSCKDTCRINFNTSYSNEEIALFEQRIQIIQHCVNYHCVNYHCVNSFQIVKSWYFKTWELINNTY